MPESLPGILMVLESVFPSPGGGGAESQVRTLGLEFLRRGQMLELIVPMVSGGPQVEHETLEGIPVTRLPYPKIPIIGALWMLSSLTWQLFVRRGRYQVIHAHIAGNMAAVSSLVGRLLGKPVLVKLTGMTEMRGGILDPSPGPGARLRRRAMRCSSAYQATSQRIAGLLVERGFERAKVLHLPNAVDTGRFVRVQRDAALRERLCGARPLVGVFVGRLEPEKGLELLVEAWARVFGQSDSAVLLLVGSGSLRELLQARAEVLGIAAQLVFVGPTFEVERYLAIADFGVLTSQFEGLSNALLEYMAAGLPVVGSRVSGTEDWVIDGLTGWLFPPGDGAALAQQLQAVADSGVEDIRRRGAHAREWVERAASIPAVVTALQTTYRQLGRGDA